MGGAFLFLHEVLHRAGARYFSKGQSQGCRCQNPKIPSKALKQVKRVERTYTRERKIEVLLNLLNCREPDARVTRFPRRRIGQSYERKRMLSHRMVREPNGAFVRYRAPTYCEASASWKVPVPTI
ncbi:hypothetical protein VTG60DRAFT_3577 [Thermothelomyces hinnuleus]